MKILALEFSSVRRSVAFVDGDVKEVSEEGTGPTNAFSLISKVGGAEVECIAVGLGPGSYTGIRVAISIAQGWQIARPVKVLGISSVEAMAVQAQREGLRGTVRLSVDAQRGEFYLATYEISDTLIKVTNPLHIASAKEAAGALHITPKAGDIAELAAKQSDFVSADRLEPIYLREVSFIKAPAPRTII